MSLSNQHWISMSGDPITGRPPPRMRIMNDNPITEKQRGAVAHAYGLFTGAVNVASASFLIQHRVLADGSRVRLESRQGVDVVLVWPAAGGESSVKIPPFFCIPFDETYRAAPKQDTYLMESFSASVGGKPPVLGKLMKVTDCSFIPRVPDENGVYQLTRVSHPGNQTWFANLVVNDEKHESAGYVLSWWGQPNRYSQSPLDVSLTTGKQRIKQEYIDNTSLSPRNVRASGWTDAMDGVLYRTTTVSPYPAGVVPPYTQSSTPYVVGPSSQPRMPAGPYVLDSYATSDAFSNALSGIETNASREAIWLNAVRFTTDFIVHSACVGKRGESKVVRIFTQEPRRFVVREFPLSSLLDRMATGGTLTNSDATLYILTFPAIDGVVPSSSSSAVVFDYMAHPFYWNADGSEAMGLFSFTRRFNTPAGEFVGTALIKLTVGDAGFATALMETSSYVQSGDTQYTPATGGQLGNHDLRGSANITCRIVYKYVLAADYTGNTPKVLRGHMEEDTAAWATARLMQMTWYPGNGMGSLPRTVGIYSGPAAAQDLEHTWGQSSDRENSSAQGLTAHAESKVSLDGTDITALTDRCSRVVDHSSGGTGEFRMFSSQTFTVIGRTPTESTIRASASSHATNRSGSPAGSAPVIDTVSSANQTGHASLWAVAGGDLRGGNVVLRESPWYFYGVRRVARSPIAVDHCTWVNSSLSYTYKSEMSYVSTYEGIGGGATTSSVDAKYEDSGNASATMRYRTDVGRFVRVDTAGLSVETLGNLVYPMFYARLGDVSTREPGGSETSSASGAADWGGESPWTFTKFATRYTSLDGTVDDNFHVQRGVMSLNIWDPPAMDNTSARTFSKVNGSQDGINTAFTGASEHTDVAFSSGAVSPDGSIQYIGIVSVALAVPNTKVASAAPFKMDQWYSAGKKITPTDPYPYTGEYKMLACPVFTGGWLTTT